MFCWLDSYSFYLEDGWSSSKDAIDAMERKVTVNIFFKNYK